MKIRNWHKQIAATFAAGGVVVAGVHGGRAEGATTLTGLTLTNDPVPVDHGSNAPGTPDVALNWDALWDQYAGWPNDPGEGVYQVDSDSHTIQFTPASGVRVQISQFDLNVWAGGGETNVDWSIQSEGSGGPVLLSGSTSTADGTISTTNVNYLGAAGESLVLTFLQTSGAGSYLAMDNLVFDQVRVPEPIGATLAFAGLGAAAMRRRRNPGS